MFTYIHTSSRGAAQDLIKAFDSNQIKYSYAHVKSAFSLFDGYYRFYLEDAKNIPFVEKCVYVLKTYIYPKATIIFEVNRG